jgi:hypothetical protein
MLTAKTDARTQGSTLIAAFHTARPPLVWRFDLAQTHSFSLALQENASGWDLGLNLAANDGQGRFAPVAHFVTHEDAAQAISKVEKAILRRGKLDWIWQGLKIFAGLAGVIALAVEIAVAAGFYSTMHPGQAPSVPVGLEAPKPIQSGVPMSADDVLTPPRP